MSTIFSLINDFQQYIVIALVALVFILFILILILFSSLGKVEKRYRRLLRGVNSKNLEELVISYLDKVDEANNNSKVAIESCDKLAEKMKSAVQKVSIVRYKAFEDVGSDLSFSIALLDENNDGVLITGIYSRNESTTYAKPIDKGISRYDLSEEEITVLNEAINKSLLKEK